MHGHGIPLSLIVIGANRHDVSQLAVTLDAVVVARPPVCPRTPQHLCADAGFVGEPALHEMYMQDYTPHARPRGEERSERERGQRARRWVVEVTHSWFNRFRKCWCGTRRRTAGPRLTIHSRLKTQPHRLF